jgi:hypothetical protein
MALRKGSSKRVLAFNIKYLIRKEGYLPKQAVAIAYAQRKRRQNSRGKKR